MIDAIKGEVRIVGRASNETLGRSGRLHVVGNEGGLDCAAADHPPTPQATIGLVQGSFRVTQRRRCLSRICSGPLSPRSALMCEQSGAIRCGAGGAKGGDQGECGLAKHAPDSEPGLRVTGAGPHAASICRSDSRPGEFSPVCPKGDWLSISTQPDATVGALQEPTKGELSCPVSLVPWFVRSMGTSRELRSTGVAVWLTRPHRAADVARARQRGDRATDQAIILDCCNTHRK